MDPLKKIIFLLMVLSTFCFATHVAVLETVSEKGVLGRSEVMYLTDKLRERANLVLPAYMNFTIMTRENINAMLPPGKTQEDCEGSCLAETGRNIMADYVAQGRVGKFGSQLTLTVELYETAGNKMVASFTTRQPDADALVAEIEKKADELFVKIRNDVSGNFGGAAASTKKHKLRIDSNPQGAQVSIDGRPVAGCSKTPCEASLSESNHQVTLILEEYFDKDTVYEVTPSTYSMNFMLRPNFGTLEIAPVFPGDYGERDSLKVSMNGTPLQGKLFRMASGTHQVELSHRCYETVKFNVGVQPGSSAKFDKPLVAAQAGLSLRVHKNGEPVRTNVYADGKLVGQTPFFGKVPLCSEIEVGESSYRKEAVSVELKHKATVEHVHDMGGW